MRVTITVRDGGERVTTDDLRGWLGRQQELRGLVQADVAAVPRDRGTMGDATEVITALLAPGGVATVLAAAIDAWVQNRGGGQTVIITRPDGSQVTVASERVKGLTAQQAGELARRIAGSIDAREGEDSDPPASGV